MTKRNAATRDRGRSRDARTLNPEPRTLNPTNALWTIMLVTSFLLPSPSPAEQSPTTIPIGITDVLSAAQFTIGYQYSDGRSGSLGHGWSGYDSTTGVYWTPEETPDLSRRVFGITGETIERTQIIHDMIYIFALNLVITPIIYLAVGNSLKQAATSTLFVALMGLCLGPLMGYSVDVARDMTGLRQCQRSTYPDLVRKRNR